MPNREDYPHTLRPLEVAKILRVNKDKVYEIIRRKDFPKLKHGRNYIIPRDAFFRWLDSVADGVQDEAM